jgi:anti-sigma regulatory factor (Ser/Thr protein kinase)
MLNLEYNLEGGNFSDAGKASSDIKKTLKQLSLDNALIKRTVVAVYEAEVNVVAHAREGKLFVEIDTQRIKIVVDDRGPGIEDIDKAMQVGYSTANARVREMGFGAGMGLPNIKKNTDELNISSQPGEGTRLEMVINLS